VVNARDGGWVADSALDALFGWDLGAVDASNADLANMNASLTSWSWCRNVILISDKDLNVASDEAMQRIEILSISIHRQEDKACIRDARRSNC
jgi:hypothetical protein